MSCGRRWVARPDPAWRARTAYDQAFENAGKLMKNVAKGWQMLLLAAAMTVMSAPMLAAEAFAVTSMEDFLDYQYALREAVESGEGKFAALTPTERTKLIRAQDEIFRILGGKTSVKRLNDRDKTSLYNAQHMVAAIVTSNEDNRSICRNSTELGTHLATVQCRTVADAETVRVENRDRFARLQKCRGACKR